MKLLNKNYSNFLIALIIVYCAFLAFIDSGSPQRSIEAGLVYANYLDYDPNSLMFASYSELFSLINLLTGLLLFITKSVSATSASIQFIQLLILSLSTYSLVIKVSGQRILGLLIVFIVTSALPYTVKDLSSSYPLIFRTEHTFGQLGLSLTILVVSLLLFKKNLATGISLGLLLGFHGAWAIWSILITLTYLIVNRKRIVVQNVRRLLFGFLGGSLLTLIGYGVHKLILNNINYDKLPSPTSNLLTAYLKYWDYHRSLPFDDESLIKGVLIGIIFPIFGYLLRKNSMNFYILSLLVGFSALTSSFLYYTNDVILNGNFINLSLLMPGRFMNLHAILFIILISLTLFLLLEKFTSRLEILNKFNNTAPILAVFIIYIFFFISYFSTNIYQKNSFSQNISSINVYNQEFRSCAILSPGNNQILTIGNSSRIIPIKCKKPIVLDTTAIDFIPYLPKEIIRLKVLVEEIYGINFNDPKINFEIIGKNLSQSGSVSEEIVNPVWQSRTVQQWEFLACKYNFKNIVVPDYFNINLPNVISEKGYTVYETKQNCDGKNYPEYSFSRPIERTKSGGPFYWLNDQDAILNIFNNSNQEINNIVEFSFIPNSCNLPIEVLIFSDAVEISIMNITDSPKNFSQNFKLKAWENYVLKFELSNNNKFCVVSGDDRKFSVGLNKLRLSGPSAIPSSNGI